MICKYCMTKIDDDSVFCESCGSRVQEIGNNDETQLIPKMKPERTVSDRAEQKPEKDIRVSDISKLLSEIYDEEEETSVRDLEDQPEMEQETTEPEVTEEMPEVETELQQPARLFCMACGAQLPEGAAFCDICGTATGEVAPAEIRRRRAKESITLPLVKGYFPDPAGTLVKAASGDAFGLGACVFAVKDILTAIIAALLMPKLTENLGDAWIVSGDAFGFAAKVFIVALLADLIFIGLIFGAGIIFRGAGTLRETVGVCGTAYILPALLWIITLLLAGFSAGAAFCSAMAALICTVIFTGKAIHDLSRFSDNRMMYMTAAVMVIYMAIIYGGVSWMIA